MKVTQSRSLFAVTVGAFASASTIHRPPKCSADSFKLPNVSINHVEHLPSGCNIPLPGTVASCGGASYSANTTSDLCRVVMNVPTSNTSSIRVEAWLPDNWNGRFLATGGGGIGGCIDYDTMQNGAQLGFAAFGTNAGHDGDEGFDFFLNQPEVINDFGHRAIHVEAETGKKLVESYYGSADFKSYYQGCSTGGRQGFQTAQMYPEDFDGVLLGAPANDWLHIVASKPILAGRIGWPNFNSSAYVRPEQWPAIVEKQIEMFDALDGVKDGIIDNPSDYSFDPQVLACGTGTLNNSLCLTPDQVLSVKAAYEPLTDTKGRIVYPPFELGANTDVFSENQLNGTELQYRVLDDFWRGAVYNDSTWTSQGFNETDMDFAINLNPGGVGFNDPDLSEYRARGGKIIAYHGRIDQTVTPQLSMRYFSQIQASLNLTVEDMRNFYQLFLVPGHNHCAGGAGAWNFGQTYPMDPKRLDTENNALLSLVKWVEDDIVPDGIIGTKYEDDDVHATISAQRLHCPYPLRSKWDGKGDTKLATSWSCEMAV